MTTSGGSSRQPPRPLPGTGAGSSTASPSGSAVRKPLSPALPGFPPALGAGRDREFEFTASDFEKVRKLIHEHAGIALSPAKQDMVYSRLARRLRACGDRTFAQYLTRLERDRSEWETFVNSLTTNLTSFFREAHHFDILAEQLKKVAEKRTIKIWCCAASTGEEPYSLAITACEAFDSLNPPVQILATDIDTAVLAHGEAGSYRQERVERLSPERLRKFFLRGTGDQGGVVKVRPELRRLITFRRINLLEANWSVQGPLDAIFCRNVMIYFDKPTQYGILKRFQPLLRPDGQLFAGHSESFMHAADLFRSRGRTVYQRADTPLR
ncbi:chemotaxis protein CheR [Azoarcus sp. TTM-91]|uniref:CheR family methyltransferase n=1 Tax=Azoarcus sp. TTM-91 TaxID=2691581 RepID=UPI00145E8E36|nr:CheR family methyltransferase [Azoarcus sp. TTM-91]NMG34779.1 chemotaxis protein CheR [Azoarcus sp. TTM-91]